MRHKKLKLTAKRLARAGACDAGLAEAREAGLLPALVSTDPEENLGPS